VTSPMMISKEYSYEILTIVAQFLNKWPIKDKISAQQYIDIEEVQEKYVKMVLFEMFSSS